MDPRFVFDEGYDMGFMGLERLHPFDAKKPGRAWKRAVKDTDGEISRRRVSVDGPVADADLARVHDAEYLASLRSSSTVAQALELPMLAGLPRFALDKAVLEPMRRATRGTILAGEAALDTGLSVNLFGGFHHAKPRGGEGFCVYNDIAVMVACLRANGRLSTNDPILYLDLDAHQGNGVAHAFLNDATVTLFDMYNADIYPHDPVARSRIDVNVGLASHTDGPAYLEILKKNLDRLLGASERFALAIYNAGTDVCEDDPLGQLGLSADAIFARDHMVIERLVEASIPTVMLPSGGYTDASHRLIARTLTALVRGFDAGA